MIRIGKAASIIGGIQCGLGGLVSVVAFLIYASSSIRDALAITLEEVYLHIFLFLVFGIFSIFSGLLLIYGDGSEG